MKYAIIENGIVTNIAVADAPLADNWIEADGARIGDSWDGTAFTTPPAPQPSLDEKRASASLTRGEFLVAVSGTGIITEAVAEEASSGAWPAAFDTFLSGLTTAERIEAKATWVDGARVRRSNPLLSLIAAEQDVTDAELDALFSITGTV